MSVSNQPYCCSFKPFDTLFRTCPSLFHWIKGRNTNFLLFSRKIFLQIIKCCLYVLLRMNWLYSCWFVQETNKMFDVMIWFVHVKYSTPDNIVEVASVSNWLWLDMIANLFFNRFKITIIMIFSPCTSLKSCATRFMQQFVKKSQKIWLFSSLHPYIWKTIFFRVTLKG